MELTPIHKLDEVLKVINAKKAPPFIKGEDIIEELKKKGIDIDFKEGFEILTKLKDDKMCYVEEEPGTGIYKYYSRFEGQLLQQRGGYEAKFKNEEEARNHAGQVEKALLAYNKWIVRGTVGAAVSTTLYLLWTVFSYGLDHNWWFSKCIH